MRHLRILLAVVIFSTIARAQLGKQQGLVEPNVADEKGLLALPHMNETIVKALMAKRPFMSAVGLNEFLASQSLTAEQVKEVLGRMFVHINLNKASDEEIRLIPGIGNKMLHEFKEYRPYKSIEQFHKEIGKYVDEKELARLEQYVFVPINLNTATDEQILTIPGSGRKVVREFKEYRPYKSMEQFRKEMGKYWNEKEVARLERYVTID